MLLRLLVNVKLYGGWSFVAVIIMNKAYSSTCHIFGNRRNLLAMQRLLFELYTHKLSIFPMSCLIGNMKPSMYTHYCGLYLGGIYAL